MGGCSPVPEIRAMGASAGSRFDDLTRVRFGLQTLSAQGYVTGRIDGVDLKVFAE